jgi:predicted DCC family thiol-disulfide oxidoreductase YuxK
MDPKHYPLEFLYDGQCPICSADVARLRKADHHQRLIFIDITATDFNPRTYCRSQEALLARIHARRADGVIIEGPEVFRLALEAIELGWLVAPTRWPLFSQATEIGYTWLARHRGSISRRLSRLFPETFPECRSNCGLKTSPNTTHTEQNRKPQSDQ